MTREEIIDKLRDEMKKSSTVDDVDWDAVTVDTEIETLGFDSLSILDLIYDVQQAFGLTFEAEKLTEVRTVGNLVDFLQKELAA
jgi:acyl carrier protein